MQRSATKPRKHLPVGLEGAEDASERRIRHPHWHRRLPARQTTTLLATLRERRSQASASEWPRPGPSTLSSVADEPSTNAPHRGQLGPVRQITVIWRWPLPQPRLACDRLANARRIPAASHIPSDRPAICQRLVNPSGSATQDLLAHGHCGLGEVTHSIRMMRPGGWAWTGSPDYPSAASAIGAITCAIGAASLCGARDRAP